MAIKGDERDAEASKWPSNAPPDGAGDWEKFRDSDMAAGFEVLDGFERFNQRNDVFCRARWDDTVITDKAKAFYGVPRKFKIRKADGFTQRDFALREASWVVANIFRERGRKEGVAEGFQDELHEFRPQAKEKQPVESVAAMTADIRKVAKFFGADLVGFTEYDERWVYTRKYSVGAHEERPNVDFDGVTTVIVLGHGMDNDLISAYPSALATSGVGQGYSSEAGTVVQLAQFIRNLGYRAVASMNDTAMVTPYAIKAGLGEYGRSNMVITKEFGPRVRFSKIFTDLPLAHDAPKLFGVTQFCRICDRCVKGCPPRAVPEGPPTAEPRNRSNLVGVRKWQVDAEKCFAYWTSLGCDCGICLRICPYNKDFSKWTMRLARRLAATRLRRLMLRLDIWLGYGKRRQPRDWWAQADAE